MMLFRIISVLLISAFSAYTDLKEGLIWDEITLPAILLGIFLNLFPFQPLYLALGILTFAFSYFLYYFGKLGGGDVKLFTAIALLLPFYKNNIPFILLAVFYGAAIAAILLGPYYLFKALKRGINLKENRNGIIQASIFAIVLLIYIWQLLFFEILPLTTAIAVILASVGVLIFIAFQQTFRKYFFCEFLPKEEIEDDDVILVELLPKELQKKIVSPLYEKNKNILKKMEKIPIFKNAPKFAPFFLLGAILALLI